MDTKVFSYRHLCLLGLLLHSPMVIADGNHQNNQQNFDINTESAQPFNHTEKIKKFYQKNNNGSCQGQWVYPPDNQSITPSDNPQHLYANADYGYFDNQNYAELSGDVHLQQHNQQIFADKIHVDLAHQTTTATGNVMLLDKDKINKQIFNNKSASGTIIMAEHLQTQGNQAIADDVAFVNTTLQAHGHAKKLKKVNQNLYEIKQVNFTTCNPNQPTWHIQAEQLLANTTTGRGEAFQARFKIKNKTILYLPYFNFPIDDQRYSGMLLPKAGFNNDGNIQLQLPYYLNLAPNYDATLTPRLFSNRNPMLTTEFRYLTKNFGTGKLNTSYLPKDRQYDHKNRYSLFFEHQWQDQKHPNLSANLLYQHISDATYLNDFESLNSQNQLNLPRRLQVNYHDNHINAFAKVETFQTLANSLTDKQSVLDKDKPYARLPQISARYQIPNPYQVQLTGISDFAYFQRKINDKSAPEQSGIRLYNKLSAAYPLQKTWGFITPTISLQHLFTQYDERTIEANQISAKNKSQSIFVPQYSLDMGLNFYKAGSPFAFKNQNLSGGYQLLQPRLRYVYAPFKDQSNIPNYNTRLASLNYPQLFADSWFLGYDRLPDNHHLTPALHYRYIDQQGLTRFDANIGQQFYLDKIQVHLNKNQHPIKINTSGTVLQISTQPKSDLWLDFDGAINQSGDIDYYNAQLRYLPNRQSLYNIGLTRRQQNMLGQQALSAIQVSSLFHVNQNWRLMGTLQYDNLKHRYADVLAGVGYQSCCYGFSIYGRRYYNDLDNNAKPTHAIMAEIRLSGITHQQDGSLFNTISQRVMGVDNLKHF